MKKQYTLICLFLTMGFAFGQDLSKEEVLQLITDDTCTCINEDKTLFTEGKSLNQKKMALGLCLLKGYNNHKAKSNAFAGKGLEDFESIGEEVGMLMTTTCLDDFMALFSEDQLIDFIEEDDEENEFNDVPPPPPAPPTENDLNIEGKIVSLNNDAISYIEVVDSFDKKHIFLVHGQFVGAKLLKKSNLKKDFKIYFKEDHFYDLSESRYVKKKVITFIELVEN
ncbi:hypothetical protein WNY78_13575 [Psychroserpens sp. AS72]|uniref:hypothetical protein n=1 Tax=Psychroserpens sp. AS72 TaxID=3135775 RepID=UPI003182B714